MFYLPVQQQLMCTKPPHNTELENEISENKETHSEFQNKEVTDFAE